MHLNISYMGTKRRLASHVADLVDQSKSGPFLDLFSGMCSVAMSIRRSRPVWTNDLQHFAHSVGTAFLRSAPLTMTPLNLSARLIEASKAVEHELSERFWDELATEANALERLDWMALHAQLETTICCAEYENRPYHLFSERYAGAYFSLRQCIEIDSLRSAVDLLLNSAQITLDDHRWLILALAQAAAKCTTSTGHFAQPLAPKPRNINKFVSQRARSITREFVLAIPLLIPVGHHEWRKNNRCFLDDSSIVLNSYELKDAPPRVIYADPPYTNDQYSRYYHLYETLVLYDYPEAVGRGLYRSNRAVSKFSLKAGVAEAIENLVMSSCELGADLIISYPENGLLQASNEEIPRLIKKHYGRLPAVQRIDHTHSTMGASKGPVKAEVTEILYRVAA